MNNQSQNTLREFYEQTYERGSQLAPLLHDHDFMYGQVIHEIRKYLEVNVKALDLGCNDGVMSLYMARQGCDVVGIDLAENAVKTAQSSAVHHGVSNSQFFCMDFVETWTQKDVFDFVLCSHVIEHIPDDRVWLQKIAEVMKPNANLVLMTPTVHSILYVFHRLIGRPFLFDQEVGHLRRYNKEDLVNLMNNSGFIIQKIVFLDSPLRELVIIPKTLRKLQVIMRQPGIRSVINNLDKFLAKYFFPATICIHAKRM